MMLKVHAYLRNNEKQGICRYGQHSLSSIADCPAKVQNERSVWHLGRSLLRLSLRQAKKKEEPDGSSRKT